MERLEQGTFNVTNILFKKERKYCFYYYKLAIAFSPLQVWRTIFIIIIHKNKNSYFKKQKMPLNTYQTKALKDGAKQNSARVTCKINYK